MLNEDGLPIIDITEPLDTNHGEESTNAEAFIHDEEPAPLSTLPQTEREKLRARRDQILDQLEAEEAEEEHRREAHGQTEDRRKLQDELISEERRKLSARELQRRMGKALMQDFVSSRSQHEGMQPAVQSEMILPEDTVGSPKTKKSVSFAEAIGDNTDANARPRQSPDTEQFVMGDVSVRSTAKMARLRKDIYLDQPMKLDVFERVPGAKMPHEHDSDDESPAEDDEDVENDEDESEDDEDDHFHDTDDFFNDDEREGSDMDLSQAQLQREVALEYIRLRDTIGATAKDVLERDSLEDGDEWDQPVSKRRCYIIMYTHCDELFKIVPLEATLSSKPPKPHASRFKQDRRTAETSISLGATVLPRGQAHVLRKAVKTGKLADGHLVGGHEGESDSDKADEEDTRRKEMLEVLKGGSNSALTGKLNRRQDTQATGQQKLPSSRFGQTRLSDSKISPCDVDVQTTTVLRPSGRKSSGARSGPEPDRPTSASTGAFRKPPSVIPVPSSSYSQLRPDHVS